MLADNLFPITPISLVFVVKNNHVSLKRKVPSTNRTYLWHLWLGHINLNMIQRLVKSGTLHSLLLKDLLVCKSYIEGKITKRLLKALKTKNV